jgi:anti-sigma B factor antagonist
LDFFSTMSLQPPRAHLVLSGELDLFAAIQLRPRLDEAVDRGCTEFTVDATAVAFVDAGGLGMLVRLSNRVRPHDGSVEVCAASSTFQQVARYARLGTAFGLDRVAEGPAPFGLGYARRDRQDS